MFKQAVRPGEAPPAPEWQEDRRWPAQPHPWARALFCAAVVLLMLLLLLVVSRRRALPYLALQSGGAAPLQFGASVDIAVKQGDWLREDLYLAGGTGGDALAAAVYNKSPQENPGAAPAFVRAALVPVWRDGRGAGNGEPVGDWPAGVADGQYRMGGVTFTLAAGWDVPDGDGRYWSYEPTDGYFYYHGVLQPGETTAPLLQSVSGEGKGRLEVQVLAEGIEAAGDGLPGWAAICRRSAEEVQQG